MVVRVEERGLQRDRALEAGGRKVRAALKAQHEAEPIVGFGEVRREADRLAIDVGGAIELLLALEGDALIEQLAGLRVRVGRLRRRRRGDTTERSRQHARQSQCAWPHAAILIPPSLVTRNS